MTAEPTHQARPDASALLIFALFAVFFLAFVLRTAGMAAESPWNGVALSLRHLDAATYTEFTARDLGNDENARQVPVYFILQYTWSKWVGHSVYRMRMLSVLFSMLSLGLLFAVARRLYDALTALVASLLFTVSLPHIYFAQEIGFYSLITLLALLSVYLFLRAVQGESFAWWILLILADALLIWTHVFGSLLWLAQGLFLFGFRRKWRGRAAFWLVSHGLLCGLFGSWLYSTEYFIQDPYTSVATPTGREFLNACHVYAGGRYSELNPSAYLPSGQSFDRIITVWLGLMVATLAIRATASWQRHAPNESPRDRARGIESFAFSLTWYIVPPLFLFLVSQVWKPFFAYPHALFASLGLYIMAGKTLASLASRRAQAAVLLVLGFMFAHQLTVLSGPFRPDYYAASDYIAAHGSDKDPIFVLNELNGVPFTYNATVDRGRIETHEGLDELYDAVLARIDERKDAWVVLWQWDDTDAVEEYFVEQGVSLRRVTFPGIPPLYLYRLRHAFPLAKPLLARM